MEKVIKNLKQKAKENKKKITSVLGVLTFILILSGFSYALVIFTGGSDANSIQTGRVGMSYIESSNVINITNALPMSDRDGKMQTNYFDFSITSKATTNATQTDSVRIPYDLILEPKQIDTEKSALSPNQIKIYLTKIEGTEEKVIIDSTLLSNLNQIDTNYKLYSTVNSHNKGNNTITTKYRLRTWIDYSVESKDFSTKTYQYKFAVNVNSTGTNIKIDTEKNIQTKKQDSSGANAPILTANMIPVYYNESSKKWVKADITGSSSSHKWYDYDQKKWANAVTINKDKYYTQTTKSEKVEYDVSTSLQNKAILYEPGEPSYPRTEYGIGTEYKFYVSKSYTFNEKTGKFILTNPTEVTADASLEGYYIVDYGSESGSEMVKLGSHKEQIQCGYYTGYYCETGGNGGGDPMDYNDPGIPGYLYNIAEQKSATAIDWEEKYIADSYMYDTETGKFTLKNPQLLEYSTETIGKYTCNLTTTDSCEKMYKITKTSLHRTEKTDVYTTGFKVTDYASSIEVGEEIPMEDIDTMWVWVPRFKYNYFKTATSQEIKVTFENGIETTGTIKCTDAIEANSGKSENCTDTTNGSLISGTSTYTHPAFTFGDEELTGFWSGKFLNYYNATEKKNYIKPNQSTGSQYLDDWQTQARSMETIGNVYGFPQSKASFLNAATGEIINDSNNFDTHITRHMEWGAIAYLSYSKYGNCTDGTCKEPNKEIYTYNDMTQMIEISGENNVSTSRSASEWACSSNSCQIPTVIFTDSRYYRTYAASYTFTVSDNNTYATFDYTGTFTNNYSDMRYTIKKDGTNVSTGSTKLSGTTLGTSATNLKYKHVDLKLEPGSYVITFEFYKSSKAEGYQFAGFKNFKVISNPTKTEVGPKGPSSSTTGNVYGIYDMNRYQGVLGNISTTANKIDFGGSGHHWTSATPLLDKYYDKYSYGKEPSIGKLGDGTIEMMPDATNGTWNKGHSTFSQYSGDPWFIRGQQTLFSYTTDSQYGLPTRTIITLTE